MLEDIPFWVFFFCFFFFFLFVAEKDIKTLKKSFLLQCAKHPFAGQNTQHISNAHHFVVGSKAFGIKVMKTSEYQTFSVRDLHHETILL